MSEIWTNLTYLNLVMGIWFQAPAIYLLLPQLPQEMTLDSKVVKSKAMRSDPTKPIFRSKLSVGNQTDLFTNIWDGKKTLSNQTDVLKKLNCKTQKYFFIRKYKWMKSEKIQCCSNLINFFANGMKLFFKEPDNPIWNKKTYLISKKVHFFCLVLEF